MTLNVPPVTPIAGTAYQIAVGGTPVQAAPENINGGYITNPASAADQGLEVAEPLYVDPTQAIVPLQGNNTTSALQPGETFPLIAGTILPTYANAASSGHRFTAVTF